MKILVDADACPVKEIIVRLAKNKNIPVVMVCDTSHILNDGYSKVKVVDKSRDSADIVLVNMIEKSDIVVTQDYGVACLAIPKGAVALNQNGRIYDDDNIDLLMFERFLSREVRQMGRKTKNIPKRTKTDNSNFEESLIKVLKKQV